MDYTLNILRNPTVYASRELAVQALDDYEYHSYGQPVVVLYKAGIYTRVLFAVGLLEGNGNHGNGYYQIINDIDGDKLGLFWEKIVDGKHLSSTTKVSMVEATQEEFDTIRKNAKSTCVYFVESDNKGCIYKGDKLIASTSLNDLDGSVKIDNKTIEGDFEEIIQGVVNQIRSNRGSQVTYTNLVEGEDKVQVGTISIDGVENGIYIPDSSGVYKPEDENATTIAVGGFGAGVKAGDLEGKTLSEMFDILLYPVYIPKFTQASASIKVGSNIYEIYSIPPTPTITTTPASCEVGNYKVYGGEADYDDVVDPDFTTVGKKTWATTVSFKQGTSDVKDSKGTSCPYSSEKTGILRSVAEKNPSSYTQNIKQNGDIYVIKSYNTSISTSANIVYPYYYSYGSGEGYEKAGLTTGTSFIFTFDEKTNIRNVSVQVPSIYDPSQYNIYIIPEDLNHNFLQGNYLRYTKTEEVDKVINGHTVKYIQITNTDNALTGSKQYQVSISKK